MNNKHDPRGRFAVRQYVNNAAFDAGVGYIGAAYLGPKLRAKLAEKRTQTARNVVAQYVKRPAFKDTRKIIVDYAHEDRLESYRNSKVTPRDTEEQIKSMRAKLKQEGNESAADKFERVIRSRFKMSGPETEAFNQGTKAAKDTLRSSTKKLLENAPERARRLPLPKKTKLASAGVGAAVGIGLTAAMRHREKSMQKFDPNHDSKGRFTGGASLRQGSGNAPITHTQTQGEKWYKMGAKDKADAEMLARKYAGADYHAKAFEAIHDPSSAEDRVKLSELRDKAAGLKDQLMAATPIETETTRSFVQNVPKRGKTKHTKLMAELVSHIHETADSAIANGKERGLIPVETKTDVAKRAYHHGALIAMHRSGVGRYDFSMNEHEKHAMTPLKDFIRYTHRRLFDAFHAKHKGEFKVYHEQFGVPFPDHRKDKDGNERKRFTQPELVKFDQAELQKILPEYDRAVVMAHEYGPQLLASVRKEIGATIKEGEKKRKLAKGWGSKIGGAIGGFIGGLGGGAATAEVGGEGAIGGAEEGASIGSKIGGGIGNLFNGAKAAFQGSRASEGIGAAIRGANNAASKVASSKVGKVGIGAGKMGFKGFSVVGRTLANPGSSAVRAITKPMKLGEVGQRRAENVGHVLDHVEAITPYAAMVGEHMHHQNQLKAQGQVQQTRRKIGDKIAGPQPGFL